MKSKSDKLCLRGQGCGEVPRKQVVRLPGSQMGPFAAQVPIKFSFCFKCYRTLGVNLFDLVWLGFGSLQPTWNAVLSDVRDIK